MNNMQIYSELQNTPVEAQKTIGAGRLKGFTDINPMWRIKRLTEMFGPCGIGWWFDVKNLWIETGAGEERTANAEIQLFYVIAGQVSKPVEGVGGSKLTTSEKNGYYTSDECYKMAITDAIGSACKMLGMSADIYFAKDRTKYNSVGNETAGVQRTTIDINKQNVILKLCEEKGTSIKSMCSAYKVETVAQMTEEMFVDAVRKLKEKMSVK